MGLKHEDTPLFLARIQNARNGGVRKLNTGTALLAFFIRNIHKKCSGAIYKLTPMRSTTLGPPMFCPEQHCYRR